MIDDDLAAAHAAVAALQVGDERAKIATERLDAAEALVARARSVVNGPDLPEQQGAVAAALLVAARSALDVAVLVTVDPPKTVAPRHTKRERKTA